MSEFRFAGFLSIHKRDLQDSALPVLRSALPCSLHWRACADLPSRLPAEDLWRQIRFIDRLNERRNGIRILKSSEVDILAEGSLDYPDDLLKELDYTVCSIHSRFALGKRGQTERIMRAMDNRRFHILGHATGRLLLKRPGYELDMDRLIPHARQSGCFFEINSSPDRLDLSAENARAAARPPPGCRQNRNINGLAQHA